MTRTAGSKVHRLVYTLGPVLLLLAMLFAVNPLQGPTPVAAQSCSWSGTWSVHGSPVTLVQSGNQVSGDDSFNDHLTGTVVGNRLTGRWTHGDGSGPFDLTMSSSCTSFTGSFGTDFRPLLDPAFNGSRTSAPPPPVATPVPASRPPTTAQPATGAPRELGALDVAAYCRSLELDGDQLFDDAALFDDGIWYCIAFDPLGLGLDVDVSIDDLSAVCQWQYQQPAAFARQRVAGDATSWRCFSSS